MSLTGFVRLPVAAAALVAAGSLAAVGAEAQPLATAPESVEVPAHPATGTTTPAQPVSMRAGPNTGFPVIGTLRPGMPLQILATANYGWMQVQSPVGTGWVYGSYLAPGNSGLLPGGGSPAPISGAQPQPNPLPRPKPEISSP